MKKISIVFASLLSLSAAAMTNSAIAEPVGLQVNLTCPFPGDANNALANYGDYVAGFGFETVQGQGNKIYFKSNAISSDVPADLRAYQNAGVTYDSTKGDVTCRYTGNGPEFSVTYTLTNGKGGFVSHQTLNALNLTLPVAL